MVTKPDGSPAPNELIEISADNWDPEFHLQRNFTSDENGLIKFAIKKLPKDVNRLSFNVSSFHNIRDSSGFSNEKQLELFYSEHPWTCCKMYG